MSKRRAVSVVLEDSWGEFEAFKQEAEAREADLAAKNEQIVRYMNEILALRKDLVERTSKVATEMQSSYALQMDEMAQEYDVLMSHAGELSAQCERLELTVVARDKQVGRLLSERAEADTEHREALADKQAELDAVNKRLADTETELTETRSELKRARLRLDETDDLNFKCKFWREKAERLQAENDKLDLKYTCFVHSYNQVRLASVQMEESLTNLRKKLAKISGENETLKLKRPPVKTPLIRHNTY